MLRRERLSAWFTQAAAGVLGLLCVVSLATALFAPAAKSSDISAGLRAHARSEGEGSPTLLEAQAELTRLEARSSSVLADLGRDKAQLRKAKRLLGNAHARMTRAGAKAESFSRRLVSLEAREQRELETSGEPDLIGRRRHPDGNDPSAENLRARRLRMSATLRVMADMLDTGQSLGKAPRASLAVGASR